MLRHGRRHRSAGEYQGRRQVYYENKERVAAWNSAGAASHECAPHDAADTSACWRTSMHCCMWICLAPHSLLWTLFTGVPFADVFPIAVIVNVQRAGRCKLPRRKSC